MGLPGGGDTLELTVNAGREEPYDLGEGYNHLAITVEDIDAVLASMAEIGVEPEKPPYRPGDREDLPRIAFVADPDGYRIELIDGGRFDPPQAPGQEPWDAPRTSRRRALIPRARSPRTLPVGRPGPTASRSRS